MERKKERKRSKGKIKEPFDKKERWKCFPTPTKSANPHHENGA
jgi:hypothetical protein